MNILKRHKTDLILVILCFGTLLYFNLRNGRNVPAAKGFRVVASTTPAMIQEMEYAIKNRKYLAATAWRPHWMNSKLKIRYLDDPLNVFGQEEDICTVVRRGFGEDHPQVMKFLRQFRWEPADLESQTWKSTVRKGEYEANAREWIAEHPELIGRFLDGVQPEPGAEIRIVNNGFLNELTAGNLIKVLLEERLKCEVVLTTTTLPIGFEALAGGTQDVHLSVWLPRYHQQEFAAIADRVEIIGPNLHGTRLGIAVPEDIPIRSIRELGKFRAEFDGKIIGIEPGQGINRLAEEAIRRYGLE